MNNQDTCHSCHSTSIEEVADFKKLARVASDCRGWPAGGRLGICLDCSLVQAIIDPAWRNDIDEIYRTYDIYHQSGGIEQAIFDADTGAASTRSDTLVGKLDQHLSPPPQGRMLDLGCGNGAFIRAFAKAHPQWNLFGSEISDKYKEVVEAISGVQEFFTGGFEKINAQFDLVSLIHVLEHIEAPVEFLAGVRALLAPGGHAFIEVPFFIDNPYDLVIADHASHFTPDSLTAVAAAAGLKVKTLSTDWVRKEISCLLISTTPGDSTPSDPATDPLAQATRRVQSLIDCRQALRRPPSAQRFGIFGTSIGANWLLEELKTDGTDVDFFVDEDPHRIGQKLLDRPILAPADIPADSTVAIPLAPLIARDIAARIQSASKNINVLVVAESAA